MRLIFIVAAGTSTFKNQFEQWYIENYTRDQEQITVCILYTCKLRWHLTHLTCLILLSYFVLILLHFEFKHKASYTKTLVEAPLFILYFFVFEFAFLHTYKKFVVH